MKYVGGFIILILIGTVIFSQKDRLFLVLEAHESAKTAAAWIFSHPDEITDPGVIWVLDEINANYCNDNVKTTTLLHKMFISFRTDNVESAYERLINNDFAYTVSTSSLQSRKQYFDHILIPALYCDRQPELIPETIRQSLELSKHEGYPRTHALLALVWMRERNCLPEDRENYINEISATVQGDQNQSTGFGDLYAERVAFLEYVRQNDRVPGDWIRTIIDSREKSGGWKDQQNSYYLGSNENSHTTVLSLWALTQFTKRCPFN